MICEKCGKNNPSKNNICSNCKAPLPASNSCGGFADILTFKDVPGPVTAEETRSAGMSDADSRKLIGKTSAMISYNKKITLLSIITAGVATLVLILTVIMMILMSGRISELESQLNVVAKDNSNKEAVNVEVENNSKDKEDDNLKETDKESNIIKEANAAPKDDNNGSQEGLGQSESPNPGEPIGGEQQD